MASLQGGALRGKADFEENAPGSVSDGKVNIGRLIGYTWKIQTKRDGEYVNCP